MTAAEGDRIGRFALIRRLGAGGMGEVWEALDPELDRRVAIKLLHADQGHLRLAREARAMARLNHPAVVTVFDVGDDDGQVWVAMELAPGGTLRQWTTERARGWRETVAAFVVAGRGLAAAHAAGLVHRDFKPDNVLVRGNGQFAVADFGLARASGDLDEPPIRSGDATHVSGVDPTMAQVPGDTRPAGSSTGTLAAAIVGTPPYMAPEQHLGGDVDARADQFAFAVALWEALFKQRPFAVDDEGQAGPQAWSLAIVDDRRRPPPSRPTLPRWLRAALDRGLTIDRDGRYPTMDAMVDALERGLRRRRRLVVGAAAAVALVATALVTAAAWPGATVRDTRCQGMERKLRGIWDPDRAAAVRAAFVATERPYAADTFDRVAGRLDDYTRAWTAARVQACEATHLRGEQSSQLLDLRMACLDRRLAELGAVIALFAKGPSGEVLDRAVDAAARLSPLGPCADADSLRTAVPPPADPETAAKVDSLRRALAEAKALEATGQYRDGLAVAQTATLEAERIGYAPLLAEALHRRARLERFGGDAKASEATLERALLAAADARDDARAAQIWPDLLYVVGYLLARTDEALQMRSRAEAAVRRAGSDPENESQLWHTLGVVFEAAGQYDEVQRHYERALAIREQSLGPDHLVVASTLNNLGNVFQARGQYDEARRHYERALAIRENALGPDHPVVALSLNNLGMPFLALGQYDEARRRQERAVAIREKALGPDHPDVAVSLNNLGDVALAQGLYDEAQRHHERALAIWEKALGLDHPMRALFLSSLGNVFHARGQYDEAVRHHERALAILEKAGGPDHPDTAIALTGLARASLALGRSAPAAAAAERAVRIREAGGVSQESLADSRFVLARALWTLGRERPRALALARQARDGWVAAGAAGIRGLADAEPWLREHLRE